MARHENSYLQNFSDAIREHAQELGVRFAKFDMDGQDRKALADAIFTDYDYFALIEGKDSQQQLGSEKNKLDRVIRLCNGLANSPSMRDLHDRCHFIAWRDSKSMRLEIDVYRNQICNQAVLGAECRLFETEPKSDTRLRLNEFSEGFFYKPPPPKYSIARSDFEGYVYWLVSTVTAGGSSEIELVGMKNDNNGDVISVTLPSLTEVYALLDERRNTHRRSYRNDMKGP